MSVNAGLTQRLTYSLLVFVAGGAVIGGIGQSVGDSTRAKLSSFGVVLVCLLVLTRVWRAGIELTDEYLVYRGLLRSRTLPLGQVKAVDVIPYSGLLVRGSASRQLCVIRAIMKSGKSVEFLSVLGLYASGRLRSAASQLNSAISGRR